VSAFNIAVYLSGTGSNFRAINESIKNGRLKSKIKLVISSNEEAGGLEYAHSEGIETAVLQRNDFADSRSFAEAQLKLLAEYQVDLIVLAGYMKKLALPVVRAYKDRIVNIHPALLPDFGGKGMYGMFVHQAVISSGVKNSGATVHFVDEIYDNGKVILQQSVEIEAGDTAEVLQKKVLQVEHKIFSEAIGLLEKAE